MTKSLTLTPKFTLYYNGAPASGGKIYTYAAGTSTDAETYSDNAGTPNTNPVICDSRGECVIRLTPGTLYKFVAKTSADVTIWTEDNVLGGGGTEGLYTDLTVTTLTVGSTVSIPAGSIVQNYLSDGVMSGLGVYGFLWQNNVGDATNDIDIAAGSCPDDTYTYQMVGSALTKRSDATWVVGTNQGMLDSGAIGNNWYYLFVIARVDTGVIDYLCSLSSTAPTMPTSYTLKRLIGCFFRSGGSIVAFKTYYEGGAGIHFQWTNPTLDVTLNNTLNSTRRLDTIKVPTAFSVLADIVAMTNEAASSCATWIGCPDITDIGTLSDDVRLSNLVSQTSTGTDATTELLVRTSSSGQIASRTLTVTADEYRVSTQGFHWSR